MAQLSPANCRLYEGHLEHENAVLRQKREAEARAREVLETAQQGLGQAEEATYEQAKKVTLTTDELGEVLLKYQAVRTGVGGNENTLLQTNEVFPVCSSTSFRQSIEADSYIALCCMIPPSV